MLYKTKISLTLDSYFRLRTSKPKMVLLKNPYSIFFSYLCSFQYYATTTVGLIMLAWLGNVFNNLFLTYLFVTIMLLIPGMEYHGILRRYGVVMHQKLSNFAAEAKSKIAYKKCD